MKSWHWNPRSLLTLFLQVPCPLCQRPTSSEICPACQRYLQQSQLSPAAQLWQAQPAVFAWGHYSGLLKQAIAALKYTNHPHLARPLGQWLAQAWIAQGLAQSGRFTIVPIPLHPDKQKQRGYNQADLIAQSFCQFTGYSLKTQGLARIRATDAQFNLPATQREENLRQAFELGKDFYDRFPAHPVILIDDIYTTGATARTAMQTLRRHGISVRGMITVAKAEMRQSADRSAQKM